MTPEQVAEIQRLRERKVAPKQIARKLGLRPAEVKAVIQEQAIARQQDKLARGELPPLEGCMANRGMVSALLRPKKKADLMASNMGLGTVMVVRNDRDRLSSGIFLVDYYCLGVKNAMLKANKSLEKYQRIEEMTFSQFSEGVEAISLEQAQAIVFGAVDYARSLGFEPNKDFEKAREVTLGKRPESLQALEFGKEGKPFYFQGPYDNPDKIIATLDKSVGKDNYHWLQAAPDQLAMLDGW